jgi:UDP-N-acetyl-D-galactosamine dehydrogenase
LGLTFKEDCPDIRNSKVVDVISELKTFGMQVDVYDPHADPEEVHHEYGLSLISSLNRAYNAIILAVGHKVFHELPWHMIRTTSTVVYDVKGFLDKGKVTARL